MRGVNQQAKGNNKETGAALLGEGENGKPVRGNNHFGEVFPTEMATLLVGLGNIPARANFTVVNPQIKSAVGIVAYPCFVHDRCPIAPIIRQR